MHRYALWASLALQLALFAHRADSAYSDVCSVPEFIQKLDLQPAVESKISKLLDGLEVDGIAGLDEQEKGSLSCRVAGVVLGSTEVVNKSAATFEQLVEVNW